MISWKQSWFACCRRAAACDLVTIPTSTVDVSGQVISDQEDGDNTGELISPMSQEYCSFTADQGLL